jgi:ferritin-like metal-binding protein YciE
MLALENHIEEPLKHQIDQFKDNQQVLSALKGFHSMVQRHEDELKQHLKSIGGSESSPVKDAVSGIFGVAAGLIDRIRTEGVSKSLRDDYTAFNLAVISYDMLYTTASLLGFQDTANLASRLMQDYTRAIKQVEYLVPTVVAWELEKDDHGHKFDEQAINQARQALSNAWRDVQNESFGSNQTMGSRTTTTSSSSTTPSSGSMNR